MKTKYMKCFPSFSSPQIIFFRIKIFEPFCECFDDQMQSFKGIQYIYYCKAETLLKPIQSLILVRIDFLETICDVNRELLDFSGANVCMRNSEDSTDVTIVSVVLVSLICYSSDRGRYEYKKRHVIASILVIIKKINILLINFKRINIFTKFRQMSIKC